MTSSVNMIWADQIESGKQNVTAKLVTLQNARRNHLVLGVGEQFKNEEQSALEICMELEVGIKMTFAGSVTVSRRRFTFRSTANWRQAF